VRHNPNLLAGKTIPILGSFRYTSRNGLFVNLEFPFRPVRHADCIYIFSKTQNVQFRPSGERVMSRWTFSLTSFALVLAVSLVPSRGGWAQDTGRFVRPFYPYWGEAPSSFRSPISDFSSFGLQPSSISSSARSPSAFDPTFPGYFSDYGSPYLSQSDRLFLLSGSPAPADNSAHVRLHVPAGARVWFDHLETKQTGRTRDYSTPPLTPGKTYVYDVRVKWQKDGKPVEVKRRLRIRARDWLDVDLTH
jgi:uncharacterized protein (TIGR03000 family)